MLSIKSLPDLYIRLVRIIILIGVVVVFGVTGFMVIQPEHSFLDALYMTVITLSTVGFQEVHTLTARSREFTIILIVIGIATLGYCVSSITTFIVEGEIRNIFRDRKMDKAIKKLKDHIILCGYGRLGTYAAKELTNWNKLFVVIENLPEVSDKIKNENKMLCIQGNATEDEVLIEAGIERASGLIAALSEDTDNLFVTLTARRLNKNLSIISRSEYVHSEGKLISAGADKVLSPAQIAGRRMASMLINPEVSNFLDVFVDSWDLNLSLQEIHIRKECGIDGVLIQDSEVPRELRIIGLKDQHGKMEVNPGGDSLLRGGTVMIILGEREKIEDLRSRFGE